MISFWTGHLVACYIRLLALLTLLTHSALLCSLHLLAPFKGSLTHFAHSLNGQLQFFNMYSRCKRVSREQTRFSSSLETRPQSGEDAPTFVSWTSGAVFRRSKNASSSIKSQFEDVVYWVQIVIQLGIAKLIYKNANFRSRHRPSSG